MNIMITGVAGFIGFSVARDLIIRKHKIIGLDNLDNYYSVKIKKARLKNLKKYKNFFFYKIDLCNKEQLIYFFKQKKIDLIIHLAAQAGVRYSFVNPKKYIDSNFFAFLNLILCAREKKIKKIIYASSSSVYGDCKKLPVNENTNLNTKNIYSVTKKLNEHTAHLYSKLTNIKFIGLRFFTIFGEWGRPDMLIFKMFRSFFLKETLYVNNYGNHYRDFTYIKDVIKIIDKLTKTKIKFYHKIYNICSNKPISLKKIIDYYTKEKIKPKIILRSFQEADVYKTHGNNTSVCKLTKFKKFTKTNIALNNTLQWYKENKNLF